ncbi:MAG: DUF6328 family protein, partial [Mobilicoccus sp.]|nr:DUF6328 family protein [Mobilicoccus sp.]
TALVVAPVAFHRMLFRRRRRQLLVDAAHVCAKTGLATLALTIAGVALLAIDIVLGGVAGWIAFALVLTVLVLLWGGLAPLLDRLDRRPHNAPPGAESDPKGSP